MIADRSDYSGGRVVWRALFQPPRGFVVSQYRMSEITPGALVAAGFATLAYDHIGIGGRQVDRRDFYARHPRWSVMGKMVLDARHAVDAAIASPEVDPGRIYRYGYAMCGMIAALVAALDD